MTLISCLKLLKLLVGGLTGLDLVEDLVNVVIDIFQGDIDDSNTASKSCLHLETDNVKQILVQLFY